MRQPLQKWRLSVELEKCIYEERPNPLLVYRLGQLMFIVPSTPADNRWQPLHTTKEVLVDKPIVVKC